MFEDVDTEIPGGPPPEESDNRTFLIAAGILALAFMGFSGII